MIWKRFIDDVLLLFRGTKDECDALVHWLNNLMPGVIKFKCDFSYEKIVFLDLEIFMKDGRLETSLHIKPTNKQLYLDFKSNHPEHCRKGIPYSQALRVVERCATPNDRDIQLANLKTKFVERNYPSELVDLQFEKASKQDRRKLIFKERKKKTSDNKVGLILTHNQANPPIHKWIRECKGQLMKNEKSKEIGKRIQVATKQPKNLMRLAGGNQSGSGGPKTPPDAGCSKCNHCRVSCPVIQERKKFKSVNTKKEYNIRQKLNCDSDWVIYLCTCKRCGGQYVGKSKTPFKKRHSNHKQEIKNQIGGLGHHYGGEGGCGYGNFQVTLIEQVQEKTMDYLAERELFWQHQLRVYVENGANGHCYRKDV